MNNNASITEYLDNDYKKYAVYVIEHRAIPSVIDGLKPTQRKIIFIADRVWKNSSAAPKKVFQLTGRIADESYYHHGDCLDPDTEIQLSDGSYITIYEWFIKYPNIKLKVLALDETSNKFVEAIGHSPRIGQSTCLEYEIEMEDSSIFKCTKNHPFLTERGWVEARHLLETDNIINLKS